MTQYTSVYGHSSKAIYGGVAGRVNVPTMEREQRSRTCRAGDADKAT